MPWALFGTGCANASAKTAQAPQPAAGASSASTARPAGAQAAAAPSGEKKSIASLVKSSKKNDGLFTMYQDTTNGSLMMAIPKAKMNTEFIYFTHIVDAPVAAGFFRGAFGTNNSFTVRKHFNRLEFVTVTPIITSRRSRSCPRGVGEHQPCCHRRTGIQAEDSAYYLIKADDMFMTEAFTQIKPAPNPNARPGQQFTLVASARRRLV